jgi:hypothetical protein
MNGKNPFECPDEILRAMASLNSINEPNWRRIKEWLSYQLTHFQNYTSLGTTLTERQVFEGQGICLFLYNFVTYCENPKEELDLREKIRSQRGEPEPGTKVERSNQEPIKVS